jgi:hypothetical protein
MQKFIDFILYNTIVYLLYELIDKLFTLLHLYSSNKLGSDLSVMPTDSDLTFILINIVISGIFGFYIYKKVKHSLLE